MIKVFLLFWDKKMLQAGIIVERNVFPELVNIKQFESMDNFFIIDAEGIETNRYFERIILKDELRTFKIKNDTRTTNIKIEEIKMHLYYLPLQKQLHLC